MKKRRDYWVYRIIKWFVWLFYPKLKVEGLEHLPQEPAIIAGNHAQMNGPIVSELYVPGKHRTWCAGQMMVRSEVPKYAFQDFWSRKPKRSRWFYRLLSYIIAPFSACIFNNADTIAVYRDTRIVSTFKNTVKHLHDGSHIVIFPEHDVPYNHILSQFQDKFIDVAKLYYKRTGKELFFVPLYIAPKLKKIYFGTPIQFCAANPMEEERQRICRYLMDEITKIAEALPPHIVVPYRNLPRKSRPSNKECAHENAGC